MYGEKTDFLCGKKWTDCDLMAVLRFPAAAADPQGDADAMRFLFGGVRRFLELSGLVKSI